MKQTNKKGMEKIERGQFAHNPHIGDTCDCLDCKPEPKCKCFPDFETCPCGKCTPSVDWACSPDCSHCELLQSDEYQKGYEAGHEVGMKAKRYYQKLYLDSKSEQQKWKEGLKKKLDKYKCDFNWDFSAPRGGKPKHKSYIALDEVLAYLK